VRGRDAELQLIDAILHRGRDRTGGVILIEGEPGMGKSLLLAEAAKAATVQGYTTVTAVADEFARTIPLWPLLQALGEVTGQQDGPGDPDPRMRVVGRIRDRLESLVAKGPVLVTADDLQYADPVTLLALHVLPRQHAANSLSWILARSTEGAAEVARLFDLLHRSGAYRIQLGPLPAVAIAELVTDLLGVPPDESLLALATSDSGNPFLIRELLDGLREENLLLTRGGRAGVAAERVPARVRGFIQHQIAAVRPRTRQLIEVAAVLGQSFVADDLAEMLGQPPAAILPAIDEALAARVLVVTEATLSFRDVMTWRAVTEGIPVSLARSLHRQFGQVLLDRGDPLRAASHLVKGARRGDAGLLREIDGAVRQALPVSPRTAADVAMRALELTAARDPARDERSVSAIRALIAARRLREATRLIETSLARPLSASLRAGLRGARLTILDLSGRPDQVRAEAELLLAEPDVPERVRDEATVALLRALGELPGQAMAEERASDVISRAGQVSAPVRAAAKALRATIQGNQGHIAASLELSRAALGGTGDSAGDGHEAGRTPFRPLLDLAARLVDVRRFDEAAVLLSAPREDDDPASIAVAQAAPALLRARMHLSAGRMSAAASEAEAALGEDPGAGSFSCAGLGQSLLGLIALRQGDLGTAGQWLDQVTARVPAAGTGRLNVVCRILASQVAEARNGAAEAMRMIRDVYNDVRELRWPLYYDPAVPPWLVRLALEVGDDNLAARVADVIDELGAANQEFPVVAAACAHARGLIDGDPGLLRLAARTQPDPWAAASAAEDLARLLAGTGQAPDVIGWLNDAYDNFQRAGASRDAARVRGRLRVLGVRKQRQHERAAERPPRGVDSLTEAERSIAELASSGLTNRQIGEQVFVSSNTVAFHLRNVYRKLGITSRVQLAQVLPGHA
jgi:DNA-binding CsgD family transcriptional regulator